MKAPYFLAVVALAGPARILTHAYLRRRFFLPHARSAVVLGTAQYDGRPSRQFAARLDHAVLLWEEGRVEHFYPVGGNLPGDRFTEAEVGRTYLIDHGVPAERVSAVGRGNDTRGSFCALLDEYPDLGPTLVVTDPHHSLRAERIARELGIDAYASPTQTSPSRFPRPSWWLTLSHELGGLAVVDASLVVGRDKAEELESTLRRIQSALRPSRKARHQQLDAEKAAGENPC